MKACRVLGIVPVRLGSRRLPGKALLPAGGMPLFAHVARALERASLVDQVLVATDSEEVLGACRNLGLTGVRTSESHRTGSGRCVEAASEWDCRVVLDAQGDWPEIGPADIDRLLEVMLEEEPPVGTCVRALRDPERTADPNVVKVVGRADGRALYFSRAVIPYVREGRPEPERLRHVGIYAFRKDVLDRLPSLPPSSAAEAEGLEQLRFLDAGIDIRLVEIEGDPWGIETKEDYERFLQRLKGAAAPGAADRRV